MNAFLLRLDIQLFAKEDEEHEDTEEHDESELGEIEVDGEVIEHEDMGHDGGSHHHSSSSMGVSETLTADYWKQFLDLQKMQIEKQDASNEKVEKAIDKLHEKLEALDQRHAQVPASVRAEIESLFDAHKEAGAIDQEAGEVKQKSSKYKRH